MYLHVLVDIFFFFSFKGEILPGGSNWDCRAQYVQGNILSFKSLELIQKNQVALCLNSALHQFHNGLYTEYSFVLAEGKTKDFYCDKLAMAN